MEFPQYHSSPGAQLASAERSFFSAASPCHDYAMLVTSLEWRVGSGRIGHRTVHWYHHTYRAMRCHHATMRLRQSHVSLLTKWQRRDRAVRRGQWMAYTCLALSGLSIQCVGSGRADGRNRERACERKQRGSCLLHGRESTAVATGKLRWHTEAMQIR